MRRWDNRIGDIPLRYPPYSKTKHAIFRSLIDSLVGVTCPSTVSQQHQACSNVPTHLDQDRPCLR